MRARWILGIVLALVVLPADAAEGMRKLDWLVGDWKGDAKVFGGPDRGEAVQVETVRSKLGGKLLVVEGTGRRKLDGGATGDVVHEALGIVSYDEKAKTYRFDAWTAQRGYVQAWFEAGDHTARWGFDTPDGGKIRYTISRTDKGEWREVGEFSRDGNPWMPFMEMLLAKTK